MVPTPAMLPGKHWAIRGIARPDEAPEVTGKLWAANCAGSRPASPQTIRRPYWHQLKNDWAAFSYFGGLHIMIDGWAFVTVVSGKTKSMALPLLPTSLVGSYPQPDWLINREMLSKQMPPRVRAADLWRVPAEWLEQAQDDATLLAIRDQEKAGLDILTDGEIRRESYSNRFATALEGLDLDNPGTVTSRSGHPVLVPRVTGPVRRMHPVQVLDLRFLRANTDARIKITVPGPFTMSRQAKNEFYPSLAELALDYAAAVNEEIKDLFAAGADIVQIDEPWMQANPGEAREYGVAALNRALEGVKGTTAVHICFGYAALVAGRPAGYSFLPELAACPVQQVSIETAQSALDCSVLEKLPGKKIILGVLDLSTHVVETPETVAARIRRALPFVSPERLIVAPDCGLKYLPRDVAFGKMRALVLGAKLVRSGIEESQ
jgi:5-methyltetrahydropteroyltriglutamate--homocysteine methyltransferase